MLLTTFPTKLKQSRGKTLSLRYARCSVYTMKLVFIEYDTYHQIADDHSGQEEGYTGHVSHQHAVPHRLYPLPAEHPEHDHEAVHEVCKVPPRQIAVRKPVHVICRINMFSKSRTISLQIS